MHCVRAFRFVFLLSVLLPVALPAQASADPTAIEAQLRLVAARTTLWPGFNPLEIPLAVYSGSRTWLFRHPSPPAGFARVPGADGVAMDGRFPAVSANTSAEIGGVMTATLMLDRSRSRDSVPALAAVALHESFHVYQRGHHPGWAGNEGDVFLYPVEDPGLLALRRLESVSLARALAADGDSTACWTRTALGYRARRFAGMDSAFSRYERLTELNEGLATYVQLRAQGRETVVIPDSAFAPEQVRERIYRIGPALAFLLDRLAPSWQGRLEAADTLFLDQLLSAAVARDPGARCRLPEADSAAVATRARNDAARVVEVRRRRLDQFRNRPGERVVVVADSSRPLWPQGFDPLNVGRVPGGLLHTRLLKLGNDGGELEMLDREAADLEALTEAAGAHPLFNGVARVTVAGVGDAHATSQDGTVRVEAPGLRLEFRGARLERRDGVITVRLDAAP